MGHYMDDVVDLCRKCDRPQVRDGLCAVHLNETPEIGRCDCGASVRLGVDGASRQCDACWSKLMEDVGKADSPRESKGNVVPIRPPPSLGEFLEQNPGKCVSVGFFPMMDGSLSVVIADALEGETLDTARLPAEVDHETTATCAIDMLKKVLPKLLSDEEKT